MTQFRSKGKGKNRKTYPISGKKPYGVNRQLAYEEVLQLRNRGKKARLIQTNKRLDLYAPYESVIPNGHVPETQMPQEPQPPLDPEIPVTINEVDTAIREIGLTLSPKDFDPPSVYSKEGKTYVASVDHAHIMMLYASINGSISKEETPVGPKLRIPKLDYGDSNSGSFILDPEQQKSFLKDLRSNKDAEDVVLYKPSGSYETYMFIRAKNWETEDLYLSGNPVRVMSQNGTNEELLVHIPPDYVKRALKALSAINKANNVKGGMRIRFRSDYPLDISTGKPGMEFTALIAPRMEDKYWKSKELLDEKVKEGAKA